MCKETKKELKKGKKLAKQLVEHAQSMGAAQCIIPIIDTNGIEFLIKVEQAQKDVHSSDCAIHNMPAMPNGDCDCGFNSASKNHENILNIKDFYIGGELSFKNKEGWQHTKIKDIILKKAGDTLCLTIIGMDFNYGFQLPDVTFKKEKNALVIKGREGISCKISAHPTMANIVSTIEMALYVTEMTGYKRGYKKGHDDS